MDPRQTNWTIVQAMAIFAWCLLLMGCTVCQNMMRTMHYEPAAYSWKHDRSRSVQAYRQWADQAWREEAPLCPEMAGQPDYVMGFRDGFVDYVYAGGCGEPPPVPPRHFWNIALRAPNGKERANFWFDGYRHGARAARDGGYRDLGRVHSSLFGLGNHPPDFVSPHALSGAVHPEMEVEWPDAEVGIETEILPESNDALRLTPPDQSAQPPEDDFPEAESPPAEEAREAEPRSEQEQELNDEDESLPEDEISPEPQNNDPPPTQEPDAQPQTTDTATDPANPVLKAARGAQNRPELIAPVASNRHPTTGVEPSLRSEPSSLRFVARPMRLAPKQDHAAPPQRLLQTSFVVKATDPSRPLKPSAASASIVDPSSPMQALVPVASSTRLRVRGEVGRSRTTPPPLRRTSRTTFVP